MFETIMGYLELMVDFMGEETFFNLLAAVVGYMWLRAQHALGVDRKNNTTMTRALQFVEAGVAKTYQEYVRARKAASADGKLTEEERRTARQMAFTFARSYALKEGLNLVNVLGADVIPVIIEKTVGGLKREGSGGLNGHTNGNGSVTPAVSQPVASSVSQPVNPMASPSTNPRGPANVE